MQITGICEKKKGVKNGKKYIKQQSEEVERGRKRVICIQAR